jgi:hypothetical protein
MTLSRRYGARCPFLSLLSPSCYFLVGKAHLRAPMLRITTVKPHDRARARDHTLVTEIQGQYDMRLGFSTEELDIGQRLVVSICSR